MVSGLQVQLYIFSKLVANRTIWTFKKLCSVFQIALRGGEKGRDQRFCWEWGNFFTGWWEPEEE